YMVPSAWVFLAALPLTRTGKLDRSALPEPEPQEREAVATPRGVEEQIMAGIWCELLGRERVGTDEDFFALGGHSLLGTRLLSRIREVFGVEVPLRLVFESPTVAGLTRGVTAARRAGAAAAPPLERVSRDGELPLSFAQQRLWFLDQLEPGNPAYLLAGALRLYGPVDPAVLEASFTAIICRHEALRTRFRSAAGEARQVIAPAAAQPLPLIDLRGLTGAAREREAERLAEIEARTPCDLGCGRLLRTTLVRLGDEEHLLLVTIHHIVSDGWSIGVL
ncbi:MAG: non-ribosomal peptide synthetase, partial [bacterium]|nr:non-ribosomal peptide synthetase [bacterium]